MSRNRLLLAMYVTTMGMEMVCLYVGLALIREHLGLGYLAFVLILILYPLSFLLRMGTTKSLYISKRSLVFTLVALIVVVVGVAAPAIWQVLSAAGYSAFGAVLQIGFSGIAWWLGYSLARRKISYQYMCTRFQIAIPVLLVLTVTQGGSFFTVVIFFILAVLALALTRWQDSASGSTGVLRSFRPWPVLLCSLGTIVLSVIIFFVLSPDAARTIIGWLSASGGSISHFFGLDNPVSPGEGRIFDFSCAPKPSGEVTIPTPPQPPNSPTQTSPVTGWIVMSIILIAVLILIVLTVRRLRIQRRARPADLSEVETTRVSLSLFGGLMDWLKKMVKRPWYFLLSLLRRGRSARLRRTVIDEPVMSVRALYTNLLRWSAKKGLPRAQSQTPLEYLRVLCQRFPRKVEEMTVVTNIYLQARYSRGPTSGADFETAKQAWRRIKSAS
jgi:hypothetical protein